MAPARSVTSWTVPVKRPIDFVVEFLSDGVADGHHVCDHPYLYGAVVVVVEGGIVSLGLIMSV
jgi:hypothetical protein